MSETHEAAPQAVDRKELLSQQFDEVEQTVKTDAPIAPSPSRSRDEAGKFVPKDKDAAPQGVATLVDEPAWNKAPASWKKEKHPLWAGMTPEQREYAWQREEQMRSGVEPLLPKAQLADAISKVAEPYQNTLRGLGIELPQAVESLMRADHMLRTLPPDQKMAYVGQLLRSYGISLNGQQGQQLQPAYDPALQALQNELLGVKGQFTSFMQQQEAQQERAVLTEIQSFAQSADHFEEAKPAMIQLLQGGMADNLKDAYEKAIRLDPALFDQTQKAQQASSVSEQRAAADAAAKRAKNAAVSVKSATPGAASKQTKAQTRREMLEEQFLSTDSRV